MITTRRTVLILGTALLACYWFQACTPSGDKLESHFQKGYDAYKSGDFYSAYLFLEPLVARGNPAAELLLAKMYANGQGVRKDPAQAEQLRALAESAMIAKSVTPIDMPAQTLPRSPPEGELEQAFAEIASGETHTAHSDSLSALSNELSNTPDAGEGSIEVSEIPSTTNGEKPETIPNTLSTSPDAEDISPPNDHDVSTADQITIDHSNDRNVNQITLAYYQKKAGRGDWTAANSLALAYREGYYGLKPNPRLAYLWHKKASLLRWKRSHENSLKKRSVGLINRKAFVSMALCLLCGIILITFAFRHKRHLEKSNAMS